MTAAAEAVPVSRRRVGVRAWSFVKRHALTVYALLAIAYLMLPIAVVVLFSFNDPAGRFNYVWQGFTLDNWRRWDAPLGLRDAVIASLEIGALATVVATALGTLVAMAIVRHRFRGRGAANLLVFLPMSTPEIVLGASLLTTFVASVQLPIPEGLVFPLSIRTILIAHIMFNISYVVVTVKARLANFPRHLEEAAMDLGANEWTTFWKVTFPLILPGVVAAALLAFSLSIDDYVITALTSGETDTFPLFIYGAQLRGIPVQVNVIGTIIFVAAVLLVVLTTVWQRRQAIRDFTPQRTVES